MPARCIPEQPDHWPRSEKVLWEALRKKLPAEAVLLHSVRFSSGDGDWEADFVVLLPGSGFAVIEAKGGQIWFEDGQWWQRTPEGDKKKDPVTQVMRVKHKLQRYLHQNPRWTFGRFRTAHFLAVPDMEWGPGLESPGLARQFVITKDQVADAGGLIWDVFNGFLQDEPHERPTVEMVERAAEILGGRLDSQRDVAMWVEVREDHVDRVTQEQSEILKLVKSNRRFEVKGGPGTGKTWLALEQARRLCESGERVALVCYSKGLSTWLERQLDHWTPAARSRIWVGTFHALGVEWGVEITRPEESNFWEREFPEHMLNDVQLAEAQLFDSIIVDEAQDFADAWWPPLLKSLRDADHGGIFVFGDEGQGVFGREGRPAIDLFQLDLTKNVRNSAQIARLVHCVATEKSEIIGGEGPAVRFVHCPAGEVYDQASDIAIALLEEGWQPQDVAVLTTFHQHPMHKYRLDLDGREKFWESFWNEDDFFYSTVAGFKGLERPAIVLAVDGFRTSDTADDILSVGMSRARDQLVIVGDFDELAAVGGKEFAKRLTKARTES